jgi:hypothetical protein
MVRPRKSLTEEDRKEARRQRNCKYRETKLLRNEVDKFGFDIIKIETDADNEPKLTKTE